MCGTSFSSYRGIVEDKIKSPIWRVSGDQKHIVFYGDTSKCEGATSWCRKHCYIITKPTKALRNIEPEYKLSYFLKPVYKDIRKDFLKAKYVTMFGAGTIGAQFDVGVRKVIKRISKEHPNKIFRFFVRDGLKGSRSESDLDLDIRVIRVTELFDLLKGRSNVRLIFSIDCNTSTDLVMSAYESKDISSLAIVNHKDNKFLIDYFKSKLPVIDCEKCQDVGYDCFKEQKKNLLLLKYI